MKTSSRDLFDLIRSMSKSEKGYFKKNAGLTGSDKVYLKLFDAIDSQKEYDERKIKEKFKGEQFIKQISVAKNNLYSRILRFLNHMAAGGNSKFELRAGASSAELLFNKGLSSQALKLVSKLKAQAAGTEELDVLLQLIDLEKTILLRSFADNEKKLEELHTEELDILRKKESYINYQKLFNKAYYLLTRYGHLRDKAEEKQYEEILNTPYMKDPSLAGSRMSEIHYREILMYFSVSRMQFTEALEHTTACLKLIEKSRVFLTAHVDKYLSVYQNHVLQYFYLGRYKELESSAQKLLAMLDDKKLNVPERARVACIGKLYCIRLVGAINSARFDNAIRLSQETEEFLNRYGALVDNSIRIVLYNTISYLHFSGGDWAEALRWINLLLNDPHMKYFVEISCNARWFELLIHFELGNYDYIDNILSTNKRYLDRNAKLFGIEKLMIRFFSRAIGKDGSAGLYDELLRELKKVSNSRLPADYGVDYYNITAWAQSKAEGKRLREFLENTAR